MTILCDHLMFTPVIHVSNNPINQVLTSSNKLVMVSMLSYVRNEFTIYILQLYNYYTNNHFVT